MLNKTSFWAFIGLVVIPAIILLGIISREKLLTHIDSAHIDNTQCVKLTLINELERYARRCPADS